MTKEEAIKELRADVRLYDNALVRLDAFKGTPDRKRIDALEMGIEALKNCKLTADGTLVVNVPDGGMVKRVLVCGENHVGDVFYPEEVSE